MCSSLYDESQQTLFCNAYLQSVCHCFHLVSFLCGIMKELVPLFKLVIVCYYHILMPSSNHRECDTVLCWMEWSVRSSGIDDKVIIQFAIQ